MTRVRRAKLTGTVCSAAAKAMHFMTMTVKAE
jgi:hypothetical protein